MQYAIKYQIIKYDGDYSILLPKKVVKGKLENDTFITENNAIIPYITNESIEGKYVTGIALTMEEIKSEYEIPEFSDKEVLELFYMFNQDKLLLLKNNNLYSLDIGELYNEKDTKALYECIDGETALYLNKHLVDSYLKITDINQLKETLRTHIDKLVKFNDLRETTGATQLLIKNGQISTITLDKLTQNIPKTNIERKLSENKEELIITDDFSVQGLYNHLKENIIGHDEELKKISTVLFMNYFSNAYYGTESILVPGPTGTGKTATFNAASSYFDIPFKNINTVNIVPEGIVGTTLEDEFESLIDSCNGDIKKAEKSIIVFDEFDKLGTDSLETKTSLTNIFLKVLEGSTFPINRTTKQTRMFNTALSSKICLGTFSNAFIKDKTSIGFNSQTPKSEIFDKNLLVSKGYFSNELLSRIEHFIPYKELTEENKLRIILESKLSTYLMKKSRLLNQFGIEIEGDEEFAKGVLESLKAQDKSVRDINNIIADSLLDIEYEILSNHRKYKKLVLTRDTVSKKNFDLK